eukprot:TCALIF_09846-PA protein Name:"Similar to K02A2.6 Uncharacterized protein K02A2.6 (Caenorhabditis elegans)" AED:0.34 eAED:0.34 QI:0/0/0/0.33/0.5/0.66/3/0/439
MNIFNAQVLKPMKGEPMHIYLNPNIDVTPINITVARPVPFAFREAVEREDAFLDKSGFTEPATEPTTWCSPSLVVPKPDKVNEEGEIVKDARIVTDFSALNTKQWDEISLDPFTGLLLVHIKRLIVPEAGRKKILANLHLSDQGLRITRLLAKSLYFWPGITNDINQMIQACSKCQEMRPSQPYDPIQSSAASRLFECVSVDLFEDKNKKYLAMVDKYSIWLCVSPLNKTNTGSIIKILEQWVMEYGIPCTIKSDGGPQFRSEFKIFCSKVGIHPEHVSPYHSRGNGLIEAFVKVSKSMLVKVDCNGRGAFQQSPLEWRNCPLDDGLSPAQWLFGRRQRSFAPASSRAYERIVDQNIDKSLQDKQNNESSSKEYHDLHAHSLKKLPIGTHFRIQNPQTKRWDLTGTVLDMRSSDRSSVLVVDGVQMLWNRRFIKPIQTS